MYFADSNIILYTLDGNAPIEKRIAAASLYGPELILSTQVLSEVAFVVLHKWKKQAHGRKHLSHDQCRSILEELSGRFKVLPIRANQVLEALRIGNRYQTRHYDSQIIAAALEAGCDRLYSEDMHNGLVIDDTLTILNPFL